MTSVDLEIPPGQRRVVVLASGEGTLLQALLDAAGQSSFGVAAVVSDRVDAPALARAREAGVPTAVVALGDFADRATWDAAITRAVDAFAPDLVVLAGFMRIQGSAFLARFGGRTINSHPSLLPDFPGAHAVQEALTAGATVTGCSVIQVDAGTDSGPVLAQVPVTIEPGNDKAALHERIKAVERQILARLVDLLCHYSWETRDRSPRINGWRGPRVAYMGCQGGKLFAVLYPRINVVYSMRTADSGQYLGAFEPDVIVIEGDVLFSIPSAWQPRCVHVTGLSPELALARIIGAWLMRPASPGQ